MKEIIAVSIIKGNRHVVFLLVLKKWRASNFIEAYNRKVFFKKFHLFAKRCDRHGWKKGIIFIIHAMVDKDLTDGLSSAMQTMALCIQFVARCYCSTDCAERCRAIKHGGNAPTRRGSMTICGVRGDGSPLTCDPFAVPGQNPFGNDRTNVALQFFYRAGLAKGNPRGAPRRRECQAQPRFHLCAPFELVRRSAGKEIVFRKTSFDPMAH